MKLHRADIVDDLDCETSQIMRTIPTLTYPGAYLDLDFSRVPSVKSFVVRPVTWERVSLFIKRWHYSHTSKGIAHQYCFGLYGDGYLIGAAIFGHPAMIGAERKYSEGGKYKVTELRRLCCIDKTPRNTESYFIGQMLKWLKHNTDIDRVLSYADTTYGHEGTIYKASNFTFIGQTRAHDKYAYNGKTYHMKGLNNPDRPYSLRLVAAYTNGDVETLETKPKNIYLYDLRQR